MGLTHLEGLSANRSSEELLSLSLDNALLSLAGDLLGESIATIRIDLLILVLIYKHTYLLLFCLSRFA
jgi:hypothetical protein